MAHKMGRRWVAIGSEAARDRNVRLSTTHWRCSWRRLERHTERRDGPAAAASDLDVAPSMFEADDGSSSWLTG